MVSWKSKVVRYSPAIALIAARSRSIPSGTPASSFHASEGEGASVTGAPVEVPPRVGSGACSNGQANGRATTLTFSAVFPASAGDEGVAASGGVSAVRPVHAANTSVRERSGSNVRVAMGDLDGNGA